MPTFLRVGETENIIEKTKNSDRGTTGLLPAGLQTTVLQTTGPLISGLLKTGLQTTGLLTTCPQTTGLQTTGL